MPVRQAEMAVGFVLEVFDDQELFGEIERAFAAIVSCATRLIGGINRFANCRIRRRHSCSLLCYSRSGITPMIVVLSIWAVFFSVPSADWASKICMVLNSISSS